MHGDDVVTWRPFALVMLSLLAGTMGATMSSPLYPIYERTWAISHATTTTIHVVYMVGVLGAFLCLGGLAEHFGAIAVLRAALGLVLAGLILCACAGDTVVLCSGRALIGIASGVIATAATVGLVHLEPGGPRHASLVASMTTMLGFGSGPLLCGLIAQGAPAPLVMPYVAVAAMVILVLIGLLAVGEPSKGRDGRRFSLRPDLRLPSKGERTGFLLASLSSFIAYALFTLIASLAPSFLLDMLPWHGPAVSGTAVAAVLLCSAMVQLPARRLSSRQSLPLALTLLSVGSLGLAAAVRLRSGTLFVTADLLIGMGHGLSFMSGLVLVKAIARPAHHAGTLSLYFSACYLGAIVPTLLVGRLADAIGLSSAVTSACVVMAALGCACLLGARPALRQVRRLPA